MNAEEGARLGIINPEEPSLQQNLHRLTMEAAAAERLASFWQKAIDEHGEDKAEAFYTRLAEMNICESCEVLKADLANLEARRLDQHEKMGRQTAKPTAFHDAINA